MPESKHVKLERLERRWRLRSRVQASLLGVLAFACSGRDQTNMVDVAGGELPAVPAPTLNPTGNSGGEMASAPPGSAGRGGAPGGELGTGGGITLPPEVSDSQPDAAVPVEPPIQASLDASVSDAAVSTSPDASALVDAAPTPDPADPPELPEPDAGSEPAPVTPAEILGLPRDLEFASGDWALVPAFPGVTFNDPVAMEQAPRSNTFFVTERQGRIYAFENDPEVRTKTLALDLSDVTQGEGDSGLLGLAFHPEFGLAGSPSRDHVYVHYAFTEAPIVGTRPSPSIPSVSRLSRFSVDPLTHVLDRASELVLINQGDDNLNHQGGAMFFHPEDGFLYLTVGDEGAARCELQNCQMIDKDLFSGVLRIDVDLRGGNVSHPIVRQPVSGTAANYYIPNDNPFVGQPGVLEEFYAIGLRSPHRMTYDPVDNVAWIADVGQATREEVDVLQRGANYQWPIAQGFNKGPDPIPNPVIGTWTDPVLDLTRDESECIIGGYVYRGLDAPELWGRYVFADYPSGRIYALSYTMASGKVVATDFELLLASSFNTAATGITSLAVDVSGELYFLMLGRSTHIQRLVSAVPHANAPRRLSELIGVEQGVPDPNLGFYSYEVQTPLWSDGASKRRWYALPEGASAEFDDEGPWRFPEGTVFTKHFDLAFDERHPDILTRLETRFLVAAPEGHYYGVSYRWNDGGDDADLVLERRTRDLVITQRDGSIRRQRYEFPGPNDCLVCHNQNAGHVLGVRTEQLNRAGNSGENQLVEFSRLRLLDREIEASDVANYPSLAPIGDNSRSLEERVRSYWASNCSMCHGVSSEIRATWDARYATPLDERNVILAETQSPLNAADAYVVLPGDFRASAMFTRINTSERRLGAMPPLSRRRVDPLFADLLRRWILSLPPPPPPDASAP